MLRWTCYLLFGLSLLLVVIAGYVTFRQYRTAADIAISTAEGIESMEMVSLGGVEQQIYVRGEDRDNPVLLFLHGGPGFSEMVPVRHYNRELEEHFVVVNWDQRGSGKSFSHHVPPESMNLQQIVDDALELTRKLRRRFNASRIYLVGHSWGSIVGVHAVDRHPEYYCAYVGVGQAVNFIEAENISYEFTLRRARELGEHDAMRELQEIGPPPYPSADSGEMGVQRKWLFRFGGEVYEESNNFRYLLDLLRLHLFAPEYSVADIINLVRGGNQSSRLMWEDLLAVDLPEQVPQLEVPVYFFTGRHDYVTVYEKVQEYYETLNAAHKEIVWFDSSAHSPNFEEPEKFVGEMLRVRYRHPPD